MRLFSTTLPDPATIETSVGLLEMTLRSFGSGPPTTLSEPTTSTPAKPFGRAPSPAAFVPM